jgi:hypothetical protein
VPIQSKWGGTDIELRGACGSVGLGSADSHGGSAAYVVVRAEKMRFLVTHVFLVLIVSAALSRNSG